MAVSVPPLVQLWIAKAEIAADVDDRSTFVEPGTRLLRGFPHRQRREDYLGVADLLADDERVRRRIQMRLRGAERLAAMGPCHGGDEPRLRVPEQEACDLAARITGNANDSDASRHRRRIMRPVGKLCNRPHLPALHEINEEIGQAR